MKPPFSPEQSALPDYGLRLPPHSIDAEQAVLGGLMLASDALGKVCDFLTEDDFYRKDHRLIFRAIVELDKRGDAIDAITLGDWFDAAGMSELIAGSSYLVELANATPSAANIIAYAEIVVEKSRLRKVIDQGTKIVERAYAAREESSLIVAEANHELMLMSTRAVRGGLEHVKAAMRRAHAGNMERYEQYKAGVRLIGQPWPWRDLNERTKGMRDRTLYVVGARPSMGKTIFGLQTAVFNALRGNRTAFFSVEMGAEEIMNRAIAQVGRIPHDWVEQPRDDEDGAEMYWSRYTGAMGSILESDLLIDETPMLSARQMMARARRAHMQKPLRLIVVDHMHDMEVDANNARFDYGVITQTGKTMAKEFGCPVILLAQLNRDLEKRNDKRPQKSDLRESGEIEQKADVIFFLYRDDYYNPGSSRKGVVEVIPSKGRNMRLGDPVSLGYDFSHMAMNDWDGGILPPLDEIRETPAQRAKGYGRAANF